MMSALVNICRKVLLSSVGFRKRMMSCSPMLLLWSSTLICLMIWRFVSRSCLAFSIIPRLIQPRRCYCIRLEMMFKCFASINPLSESRRSFQWMLLSNIPWMAPDGMAFKKNYTNKQIKLKWTAAPSKNFFKILVGIIKNYPYSNVCLCRIIMTNNECLQQQQEQQLYFSTLHWFTWYKKNRYNYGESTGCP